MGAKMGATFRIVHIVKISSPNNVKNAKGGTYQGWHLSCCFTWHRFESVEVHRLIAEFFAHDKAVGAICHGVVAACRSRTEDGISVLHGRRTTALPEAMELAAWRLTRNWLGDYYRTYPVTVQAEVTASLASTGDLLAGPRSLFRVTPERLDRGFVVRDGIYISAR